MLDAKVFHEFQPMGGFLTIIVVISFFILVKGIFPCIIIIQVLSALQNKSPESKVISPSANFINLRFLKPVPEDRHVATAQTAIIAVVMAAVGKLNEPADKDFISIN